MLTFNPDEFVGLTRAGRSLPGILELMQANTVHRNLLNIDVEAKRKELSGPFHAGMEANLSPLESMLIERVLACWLLVSNLEDSYANLLKEGLRLKDVRSWQIMLDGAYRRYLSAVKTLAQVRRLQVPLNIQVNVAANGGSKLISWARFIRRADRATAITRMMGGKLKKSSRLTILLSGYTCPASVIVPDGFGIIRLIPIWQKASGSSFAQPCQFVACHKGPQVRLSI